jgi:hypothetical protein
MGLGQDRETVVGKSLDQPQFPQRAVAIERLGEDPAAQPLELGVAAWLGQRGVAHMVGEVEVRVVDPHRAALAERHEREPLAVSRHQMKPPIQQLEQLVVGGRLTLEHGARRDVHVGAVALEVQERAVEAREPVGVGHAVILAGLESGGAERLCDGYHTRRRTFVSHSSAYSICRVATARCGGERGTQLPGT